MMGDRWVIRMTWRHSGEVEYHSQGYLTTHDPRNAVKFRKRERADAVAADIARVGSQKIVQVVPLSDAEEAR